MQTLEVRLNALTSINSQLKFENDALRDKIKHLELEVTILLYYFVEIFHSLSVLNTLSIGPLQQGRLQSSCFMDTYIYDIYVAAKEVTAARYPCWKGPFG